MSKWYEKKEEVEYAVWQALKTGEGLDYYYNTQTGVTTWDKPDELKSEDELHNQGEWVWIPDDTEVFVAGTVQSRSGGKTTCQDQMGNIVTVKAKIKLAPLKPASLKRPVSDLVLLDDMTVPLILYNLKQRFNQRKIYTNVGTILISLNPYQNLGLYTPEKIYEYQYRGVKELPPHVFNIAHSAYKGMIDFKTGHSIIISGESGAGKTEATKQCLSYLAAIAGSVGNIEQRVLQANPILEAFGNAKTVRNDNSSRFGKYMEIYFDKEYKICGSQTRNYLLEKIRVIQQQKSERNFHSFYQLIKASTSDMKRKFFLGKSCREYAYINASGCVDVAGIDDHRDFEDLLGALKELLFTKSDQDSMFATTAAVLTLGNVEFKGGHKATVPNKKWIEIVAKLLKINVKAIMTAMTIQELRIKGQATTKVALSAKKASDTRHALAKFIYGKMFDWIVKKVNESMNKPNTKTLTIGILDIFGFEIFEHNSFEQLCINFTNEMLQQHFNNNTFKLEERIYKEEGIKFKHVDYVDNKPVIDLLTKKPSGIFCQWDEELVVPKGSDEGCLGKMAAKHGKSARFKTVRKNPMAFIVVHYAGQVEYDGEGFMEKNRDTLTQDVLEMLYTSSSKFMNELFPKKKMSSKDKKASLAKQFTAQLRELMKELNKTEPHYIRCVKPNPNKSASLFVPRMCYEQLTYSGVFEAVAIRKQGYPFRLKHDVFLEHYKCILPDPRKKFGNSKTGCKEIIKQMQLNSTNTKMGSSQVLYRSEEHKSLELQRSIKVVAIEMDENLERLIKINIKGYNEQEKEKYFEQLSRAVEQADEFRLKSSVSNKARKLLEDYIESRIDDETKRQLNEAYEAVDQAMLEAVLEIVDQYGYKTKKCIESKRLLARILRIDAEAIIAGDTLQEHHVNACIEAANEINLETNDWINYFLDLVADTDGYLLAQYERAVQNKNHDRAIRIGIRQKNRMYEQKKNDLSIHQYPKLKNPSDWAGEKLFGKKEQLIAQFLSWQKDKLHSPLCKYVEITDKKMIKENKNRITDCFKYLLKYCGQRVSKSMTQVARGRQGVTEGLMHPEIRDEIYIQIIKQVTNNPDPPAIKACWDLMALCLLTFPPSADLEDYLEVYLRANAPKGKTNQKYVGWLRQRVYHGQVACALSEADMEQIEKTLESRARGFSEPLPPGQPPYQDLLESYWDQEEVATTFRRDLKGGGGGGGGGKKKSSSPAVAAAPDPGACAWKEYADEQSGDPYYYNEETGESSWEKPPEMLYARVASRSVAGRGW